jgi:hypothetical protein
MENVELNKKLKISPHFTLGELCKTSVNSLDGNIPSRVAVENLKRVCEWLEELRRRYNERYVFEEGGRFFEEGGRFFEEGGRRKEEGEYSKGREEGGVRSENREEAEEPIVITSGYRSPEVNRAVGGSPTSNHLTGCAVDIRCAGVEQAIRYAAILLDIADEWEQDFDELLTEHNRKGRYWVHFAVKPKDNRRKILFLQK